jgi:hypothetical protein
LFLHCAALQQVVPPQQICGAGQVVLPQQMVPAFPQKGVEDVLQHCWPALQPMLPQQNPPAGEQKVEPSDLVQQVLPALQAILPQQSVPAGVQNAAELDVAGQQSWPALQAGEQAELDARAFLIPIAPTTPPASILAIRRKACRRGMGLATTRATSSRRKLIIALF